jgi:branched-chain amino acid transport system substrate-binding protein
MGFAATRLNPSYGELPACARACQDSAQRKRREEIMRKALPLVLLLAALAAAPRAHAADTVKIGILWPLTGNAAAAGQASKAAADIVNNAHPEMKNLPLAESAGLPGLGGAKLELVFADHQGNPSVAQNQALRLVTQDRVHVLFGAYQSSCTFTATAVAERYGIPFVVGDSSALNITGRGFKWTFRVTPIASDYADTYMRFFADMRKAGRPIKSIAIVNENTDYGTSVGDTIAAAAGEHNVPVAARIPYSANAADVSAQVLTLKDKQPEVVIFISYTSDSIL